MSPRLRVLAAPVLLWALAAPACGDAAPATTNDPDASFTSVTSDGATPPAAKSAGCGRAAQASGAKGDRRTVDVDGKARAYVLFVPKGYDAAKAYPLLVELHGVGATGAEMAEFVKMQDHSAGEAIVTSPDALGGRWDTTGEVDLRFFDALVRDVSDALCVAPSRVFVLGFSLGAYMANHLGCARSAAVRAIIPADGGFPDKPAACGRTAALVYHRREDPTVPLSAGVAARDAWIGINGCKPSSRPVTEWGLEGLGCVAYDGCPGEAPVLFCEDTATSPYKHDLRDVYRQPMWRWLSHF